MVEEMLLGRLNKYILLRELGRGAYGTVYLARDTALDVARAVKVLHPALITDPVLLERFRREARLAARLDHPHIVTVYDFGEAEGKFYLAMRYMEGGSLKERLETEGALPWEEALRITRQVAAGLAYAHEHEVVHRDLKPGNILFDGKGNAAIGDLGFAKALRGAGNSLSLSLSGGVIGTPPYMAPEMWQGKEAGPAADQYALACIVAEMLTGQVLFDAHTPAEAVTKHLVEGPALPQQWPAGVPAGVDAVLRKALAQTPEERYENVEAFVEALEDIGKQKVESDLEVLEQAIENAIVEEKWQAAWEGVRALREHSEEKGIAFGQKVIDARLKREAKYLPQQIEAGRTVAVVEIVKEIIEWEREIGTKADWRGLSQSVLAFINAATRREDWESVEQALELLMLWDQESALQEKYEYWKKRSVVASQSEDWKAVILAASRALMITGRQEDLKDILSIISSELEFENVVAQRSTIEFREEIKLNYGADVHSVAFSPQGKLIAAAGEQGSVYLWSVPDSQLARVLKGLEKSINSIGFSPDGAILAAVSDGGMIGVWQVDTGEQVRVWRGHSDDILSVAFSPSGERIATVGIEGQIILWQPTTGQKVQVLGKKNDNWGWALSFSPDGNLLAVGRDTGEIQLWSVKDGVMQQELSGHSASVLSIAFAPDGNTIASASADGWVNIWSIPDGELKHRFRHASGLLGKFRTVEVTSVAFSVDGTILATGGEDRKVRLWKAEECLAELGGHADVVESVAFSPDGTLLASGSDDGTIRLWGVP